MSGCLGIIEPRSGSLRAPSGYRGVRGCVAGSILGVPSQRLPQARGRGDRQLAGQRREVGVAADQEFRLGGKHQLDEHDIVAIATGNRHALDYEGAGAPALHIHVQELYGLKEHPTIARGRLPLTLYLLSPSHQPIQITRDLPGFWSGSWAAVRSDMRGQYPKHVWPDDPAHAAPTARAKPRGT